MSFNIQEDDVFKVAVVATMSSGKSTFINALLGIDLLPSKNEACTAKTISILDNDKATDFKAYLEYSDGRQKTIDLSDRSIMELVNDSDDITDVLIEGNIPGLRNIQKSIMIIDTPGVNNSMDERHGQTTETLIDNMKHGLIVYVVNATQIGITDDRKLLNFIVNKVNKSEKQIETLFVINKVDEIDFEREDFTSIVDEVKKYIENAGIQNTQIVPVSSMAAKIFKKALSGCKLTRNELRDFDYMFDLFKPVDFNLASYAYTKELSNHNKTVEIGGKKILYGDLMRAVDNTGLTCAQTLIESAMLSHELKNAPKLKIRQPLNKCDQEIIFNIYHYWNNYWQPAK